MWWPIFHASLLMSTYSTNLNLKSRSTCVAAYEIAVAVRSWLITICLGNQGVFS